MKSIYILGIHVGHNSTATILKDGQIMACVSEERFNNIKNYQGFPRKAISYCLEEVGIKDSELDLVTIPNRFEAPVHSPNQVGFDNLLKILNFSQTLVESLRKLWGSLAYRLTFLRPIGEFSFRFGTYTIGGINMHRERKAVAKYFGIDINKVKCFDHHSCHAASAYYSSPFNKKKALAITVDAEGDLVSSTVSICSRDGIKRISMSKREDSLGYIYSNLTTHFGMKNNEHEYKIMGLAPYAKGEEVDKIYKKIEDIIVFDPKKLVFKSKFNTVDTDKFLDSNLNHVRFDTLAGAFQKLVEERMVELVASSINLTGIKTVVCSGGVFMNVKANQKISEIKAAKKMYFMPSASDESLTIGSCYLGYLSVGGNKEMITSIEDLYWGPKFENGDIEKYLKDNKCYSKYNIRKVANIEHKVAQLLSIGKIVARLSGRMEFGARALGNRSILANPSKSEVVKVINEQIKNRDFWMPFAPTILDYRMDDYLKNSKKVASPYMILSFNSTSLARNHMIAALHPSDFTLRPQVLTKRFNEKYYNLVKEFEKLTGIGGVLNTSFNLHGFPVVMGPHEALNTFKNSGLEYLAINDYLITKK